MPLRILLLLFFLSVFSGLLAQKANNCYTELRQEGVRLLEKKDFRNAIDKFFAARYCPDKPTKDDLDNLIKRTQNQWVKALDDAKKATERALAKADSLIAYFGFAQDRAWAYKNGKFAVIDRSGKRLTDFDFENPAPFQSSGYAIAQKDDGLYYVIHKTGKISEPHNYLFPCNNGWYKVKKGNLYTFYDKNFKQVEGWDWYDEIVEFKEGKSHVQQNGKWGILDIKGRFIIPPQYDWQISFSEGLAVVRKNDKLTCIDTTGKVVLGLEFDRSSNFEGGIARVTKGEKMGLIDRTGKVIVSPQFDEIQAFQNDIAIVTNNNNLGYLYKNGKLIAPQFEAADDFYQGAAAVKKGKLWGLIDTAGNFIVQPEFSEIDHYFDDKNFIKVEKDFKWGLIDRTGKKVVPPQFDLIYSFSDELLNVKKRDKWGLMDLKGNVIIEPQFDGISPSGAEHLVIIKKGDKEGYFDISKGTWLLEPQLKSAEAFKNGVAIVRKDSTISYIDTTGNFITGYEPEFKFSHIFPDGNKWEEKDGKWGFLHKNGTLLLDYQFDAPFMFVEGVAAVRKSGKWGLIDKNGKMLIQPQFDNFSSFDNNRAAIIGFSEGVTWAKKENKWGLIDKNGRMLITPRFDEIHDFKNGEAWVKILEESFRINKKGELIIEEAWEKKE